ncbi:MAG: malto-oligosyltrehalose trehalohydrolase [Candidatus Tectomicrobia bacterium]|nr:malto-oligosyltrehalose trehalohydrolase [Candidatus Tectomicrobia bacterium]
MSAAEVFPGGRPAAAAPAPWLQGDLAEWRPSLGATYLGEGRCRFLVWAPFAARVAVQLQQSEPRRAPLQAGERGYHAGVLEGVWPGSLYRYELDGERLRPDPASRSQPHGVHGPSEVVDLEAQWQDDRWPGLPLWRYLIYELHPGTFTLEGTFAALLGELDYLAALGVTALELMPVAQFPGQRNWGYDGVYPYAVQHSYGGPRALQRLVDAAHQRGLAVVLDVVYNHLGPEGNYLADFGPYFTDRYRTPWGSALNFDGPHSDEVRRYFIENALAWVTQFHIDALRLDAVHAILDGSARPFLEELGEAVHAMARRLGRQVQIMPESDLNDPRLARSPDQGGCGLDAVWTDDFHHAFHALVTGERSGYYEDFGSLAQLAAACREGFVYCGQHSAFRQRRYGRSSRDLAAEQHIVFLQNHDQIGNRRLGERLSQLVSFEAQKLAAGVLLLSPFLPLLFMGEEYGETAPFLYFVSHGDAALIDAVRRGRREEFAGFAWQGAAPDPQAEETFRRSTLRRHLRRSGRHAVLLALYTQLIALRKTVPALARPRKETQQVACFEAAAVLTLHRQVDESAVFVLFHFGNRRGDLRLAMPDGEWERCLDSADQSWGGSGSLLPERLASGGEVDVTLQPTSFALWLRAEKGAPPEASG